MKQLLTSTNFQLRQLDGPKTRRLVRRPGQFGLGQIPSEKAPDATTTSVCGFCSTGCGLNVHLKEGEAINLTPATHYPVNLGMACPKGWEALTPLDADDRATSPMYRPQRGQSAEAIPWNEAAGHFSERFQAIQKEHGDDSVAFISTGQIVTEEMAFLGALAKFGMGIKHGDGNTRQCMATAVVAYKQSFGFDSPPYTYQDFEESDVIVLVGSNLCIAHPIMWQRVERNPHNPEIIVVDPRRTETAVAATQHYPIRPKSDLIFFYGLAKRLIELGAIDQSFIDQHTNEFDDFANHVASYDAARVEAQSGITEAELNKLAQTIADGQRVSFWWTMGVNQGHEATRTAQSIINLALMTGNIGRPGTGANSITGQCNAMGSRLFSNTTGLLGGHDFANQEHREKVANILGIEEERIPQEPSMAYDQIIENIHAGKIRGLWVIATNGAHSWIHQDRYREAMEKLDFLVVQDMYGNTETAEMADLILPAAAWGEKEGIFINSERRLGVVKKVHKAPGQALSDFNIFRLLAQAWGCGEMFAKWQSPAAAFEILKELSAGQPCDITGIESYQHLDELGGVQWPCTGTQASARKEENQCRLFEDRQFYHPDKRAKFLFADPLAPSEWSDEDYPLILLTGRGTSAQWHTQSRTSKSEVLKKLYPQKAYVEVHPEDAEHWQLKDGDKVIVSSRRAEITVVAHLTPIVQRGQVFMSMHYPEVNRLTHASFDPYSRQPSYKCSAVSLRKALS